MPQQKDYYKTLGVSESAQEDDIKRAYRTLAKKHHPDANPGNKSAEEKFKEISEAYYVLSDKKRRGEFDSFKRSGFSSGGYGGRSSAGGRGFQGAQGFDFEEVLRSFRGAQSGRGGASPFGSVFESLFGSGGYSSAANDPDEYGSMQTASADIGAILKISKSRAEKGGEVSFAAKSGKTITVKIPPGITTGKKLRLSRQGNTCPTCEHPGDLILTIRVE